MKKSCKVLLSAGHVLILEVRDGWMYETGTEVIVSDVTDTRKEKE